MSDGKRESKVVWPNVSMTGGDLDEENRQRIHELVDDFWIALEREAEAAKVNRFVFPLFDNSTLLLFSPPARCFWLWRPVVECQPNTGLIGRRSCQPQRSKTLLWQYNMIFGWERIFTLSFPRNSLAARSWCTNGSTAQPCKKIGCQSHPRGGKAGSNRETESYLSRA